MKQKKSKKRRRLWILLQLILPVVAISTAVAARCAAAVANRLDPDFLRKLTGAFLLVLAAVVLLVQKFL